MKYILLVVFLFMAGWVNAQRVVVSLNKDWKFTKDIYSIENNSKRVAGWQHVSLPHTWNVADVMDDTPGYYRGVAWYRKKIMIGPALKGKNIYLLFEGANQRTTVFVNGKNAGEHIGGYTAFTVPVTALITPGKENELLIKVDNSYDKNIPPLSADFTFYGGLYRDVSLIAVDAVHFPLSNHGSKGVFISTPVVSKESAAATIRSVISNDKSEAKKVTISTIIYDAKGKVVAKNDEEINLPPRSEQETRCSINISPPQLWSPSHPYLYKAITVIKEISTGRVLDEISNPLGFRWFSFDGEKGFFLNGEPLKLIGASRHQDRKGMGNAVSDKLAREDVLLIKKMGGNFLRVAHYPQDPSVMKACDELGILTSVEIPLVNEITESDSFYNNSMRMQVEMIRQNFNHPSVIIWCYMNEILLKPQFNNDKERQQIYFSNIAMLAKKLDSITRKEDPSRYTMMADHGAYNRYRDVGLLDIPMIVGWNLYSGWYGANMKDFPDFLDKFHKDYPAKPMMVTEYGADADPRIRSNSPVRFDKSVEYTTAFHRYYLPEILKRPFVAGSMVWNLADFNSETRNESMPHINNKGLLEWDRTPKDPYYYYKAMLVKEPFIKILGASLRGGVPENMDSQLIQVANNFDEVYLAVNGISLQKNTTQNGIAEWRASFKKGINTIHATAKKNGKIFNDEQKVEFRTQQPGSDMNILLGAKRYFIGQHKELWIPGQEYRTGSWGYTGGKAFKLPGGNLPYGTDKNILGTDDDPVYQTQQTGITAFKVDVPDGEYELTLHFAELVGGKVQQLVYNLDSATRTESAVKRIFDVAVNDVTVLKNFNIEEQYGIAVAVRRSVKVTAKNKQGIRILFKPVEGEAILNALQIKRLDKK